MNKLSASEYQVMQSIGPSQQGRIAIVTTTRCKADIIYEGLYIGKGGGYTVSTSGKDSDED